MPCLDHPSSTDSPPMSPRKFFSFLLWKSNNAIRISYKPMIQPILLLGNPQLYQVSTPILPEESALLPQLETDLHDTLMEYRACTMPAAPSPPLKLASKSASFTCTSTSLCSLSIPRSPSRIRKKSRSGMIACVSQVFWYTWNVLEIVCSPSKIGTCNLMKSRFQIQFLSSSSMNSTTWKVSSPPCAPWIKDHLG